MSDIKSPNRSELLEVKDKIKITTSGHSLLKKKMDGLILEFFKIFKLSKDLRTELNLLYVSAKKDFKISRVFNNDLDIKVYSKSCKKRNLIEFQKKNIMGLTIPKIKSQFKTRLLEKRDLSLYLSSSMNKSIESYDKVVEKIITVSEIETILFKLLEEINKTKRRVNSLQFNIIPNLEENKKFILLSLDEIERENILKLKKIKSKVQLN